MKKRMIKLIFCLGTLTMLCGCGKNSITYPGQENVSESDENTDESTKDENPLQISQDKSDIKGDSVQMLDGPLAERIKAQAKWNETIQLGQKKNIKVTATVSLPDTDKMAVLSAKKRIYTKEEKENLATDLFDPGTVRTDYNKGINDKKLLERAVYSAEMNNKSLSIELEYMTESEGQAVTVCHQQVYKDYKDLLNNYKEGSEDVDYSMDDFTGYVNGEPYQLSFANGEVVFKPLSDAVIFKDYKAKDISFGILGKQPSDNQAQVTEEKAKQEASALALRLCGKYMEVSQVVPMEWAPKTGEIGANEFNGYVVVFLPTIDGVPVKTDLYSNDLFGNRYEDPNYLYMMLDRAYLGAFYDRFENHFEQLTVFIDDRGIIKFVYTAPTTMEMVTEDSELLQYQDVVTLFEKTIQDNANKKMDMPSSMHALNLLYIRVPDSVDENGYQILPVWRLYDTIVANVEEEGCPPVLRCKNALFLNAIDGSVIELPAGVSYQVYSSAGGNMIEDDSLSE